MKFYHHLDKTFKFDAWAEATEERDEIEDEWLAQRF